VKFYAMLGACGVCTLAILVAPVFYNDSEQQKITCVQYDASYISLHEYTRNFGWRDRPGGLCYPLPMSKLAKQAKAVCAPGRKPRDITEDQCISFIVHAADDSREKP